MEEKQTAQTGAYVPPAVLRSGWAQSNSAGMAQPKTGKIADLCNPYLMVQITGQPWTEVYEPEVALERGTIFPALDAPFVGEGACRYE